jgi:hypothetical protein
MGGRDLCEQAAVFPCDAGPDHDYPATTSNQACFSPQFALTLVSQERRVKVNGKRESFSVFSDLRFSNGKNGGRDIGEPQHGPRLHGAEGVPDAICDGHATNDPFPASLFYEEFDFACPSGRPKMLLECIHENTFLRFVPISSDHL